MFNILPYLCTLQSTNQQFANNADLLETMSLQLSQVCIPLQSWLLDP